MIPQALRAKVNENDYSIREDSAGGPALVSIVIQTYNHSAFIRECVESVLSQEVDFPIEVIVGDDCSADGTIDQILELDSKGHRFQIRGFRSNLGRITGNGRLNFLRNCSLATGKYIAFLSGDDFWTSASKLSRQVAMLSGNVAGAAHRVKILGNRGFEEIFVDWGGRAVVDLRSSLTVAAPFATSSFIMRRDVMEEGLRRLGKFLISAPFLDRPLFYFACSRGGVAWDDSEMSIYRMHPGGISNQLGEVRKLAETVALFQALSRQLNGASSGDFETLWKHFFRIFLRKRNRDPEANSALPIWRLILGYPEFWHHAIQVYREEASRAARS